MGVRAGGRGSLELENSFCQESKSKKIKKIVILFVWCGGGGGYSKSFFSYKESNYI